MAIGSSKKQGLIVPLEFDNTKEIAIAMTNVTDVELSTNGEDIEMVSTSKGSKRNFTDPYHSTLNFNIETLLTAEVLVNEIDNGGTIEEKIYSNLDTLFLQSDFKREHVGEDKVIYTPDSNAASEFTLKFVKENVLRNVKGAKGSSTISGTVGKPLAITFNYQAYADLVPESNNYTSNVPAGSLKDLVVINKITGVTVGGNIINMSSFTLNQNSEIQDTYATGLAQFSNTDFDFQLELTALRIKNDISHWQDFKTESLKEIKIVATSINGDKGITITIPFGKLMNLSDGDDSGRQTIVRTYRCQNNLGDDNIKIEFERNLI